MLQSKDLKFVVMQGSNLQRLVENNAKVENVTQTEVMHITVKFFSSRRRHTRYWRDWSSDVCSSDLALAVGHLEGRILHLARLLAEDRAKQLLLRRRLALALGRDLADEHVAGADLGPDADEIGIAPCRERVQISVVAESSKNITRIRP